jgi:hypothetical protein
VLYGRSEEEWAELKTAGKGFLIERATMRRTTTYTELNAALVNRTKTTGFNFDLDADRAAIGHLLGQISQDTTTEANGLLISALVQYLAAAAPITRSLQPEKAAERPIRTHAPSVTAGLQ